MKIRKVHPEAITPNAATYNSAGFDLYCVDPFTLSSGAVGIIDIKIQLELPEGYYGQIHDRSSLAKRKISVLGGVIDNDYRGNIIVMLHNYGSEPAHFARHSKIAQLICHPFLSPPIVEVFSLSETTRGANGFGSSGK